MLQRVAYWLADVALIYHQCIAFDRTVAEWKSLDCRPLILWGRVSNREVIFGVRDFVGKSSYKRILFLVFFAGIIGID